MYSISLLYLLFVYITYFHLAQFGITLSRMRKHRKQEALKKLGRLFFYQKLHRSYHGKDLTNLMLANSISSAIFRVLFTLGLFIYLHQLGSASLETSGVENWSFSLSLFSLLVVGIIILCDYLPKLWSFFAPPQAFKLSAFLSSLFMTLSIPIVWPLVKLFHSLKTRESLEDKEPEDEVREKMMEIIHDVENKDDPNTHNKDLLHGLLNYHDRIAREIMVPRVDMFCLSADTSIREAAKLVIEEGYTRTPVYHDNIDHILGLLMTKDLLQFYHQAASSPEFDYKLDTPIETLIKPIIFTPESKQVSQLLQEFKNRQMHIAIVVDEYGGTEGLVTIEDILEEIVGEIEDEYDEDEKLYVAQNDGSYLVDGRMSLFDLEDQIGIEVPHEGDYDSINGYIVHRIGSIPEPGLIIHHDNFDLEIISSSDRSVDKVKIRPQKKGARISS